MTHDDGCDAWFTLERPPVPPPLRVYAQKPLAVFETPHDSVIEEVIADAKHKRNGGFTRAMVVVK